MENNDNDVIICNFCGKELELTEDDLKSDGFICPNCNKKTSIELIKRQETKKNNLSSVYYLFFISFVIQMVFAVKDSSNLKTDRVQNPETIFSSFWLHRFNINIITILSINQTSMNILYKDYFRFFQCWFLNFQMVYLFLILFPCID